LLEVLIEVVGEFLQGVSGIAQLAIQFGMGSCISQQQFAAAPRAAGGNLFHSGSGIEFAIEANPLNPIKAVALKI